MSDEGKMVELVNVELGTSVVIQAPRFECEKCGRPVGARKDGHDHDWEPQACYWCETLPALKRDVARRRKLGHIVAGVDLDRALAAYRKLPPFKGNLGRRKIELQVVHRLERGTRGTAYMRERRIRIAAGPQATPERVLEVLVHEMVHLVCPLREQHGERFRRVFKRACLELWDIDVPIDAKPSMGVIAYGMGEIATQKLKEKIARGEIKLFPPKAEPPKPTRAELMGRVVEARAEHAIHMHKQALKRLKRARDTEAKWRKKVRYYEAQAAKKATR